MKQYHHKRAVLFIGVVLAGLIALLVFAGDKESGEKAAKQEASLSLDKVPAPVRATIEEHAKGAQVKEIELETEDGKEVYEVEVVSEGKEQKFMVAADGKFLGAAKEEDEDEEDEEGEEAKETVAYESLPPAVKAAVEKHLGAQGPFEVEKEAENGTVTYDVATKKQEMEMTIEVTEAGEVIEMEKEIPAAEIPAAVAAKIKATYPNATIKEATHVKKFSYEVELLIDGKKQEVKMSPAGQSCSEEHEGEHHKGAQEEGGGKAIKLSDIPAPARATIERLMTGGEIKMLDKEEEAGKVIYDVEGTLGGKDVEYDVASDGTVLTSEESVPYASLPQVVRDGVEKYFGSAEGIKAFKELEKGETFYEVQGKKAGATKELKLTDKGEIIEEE